MLGAVPETLDLGLYVHVPWCRALCPYCDFPVAVARDGDIPHREYLEAVLTELDERAPGHAGRRLVSIYIGGGTPSLWRVECLHALIARACSVFGADRAALEITLEANPRDCTAQALADWRAAGINRLSIGVQSTSAGTLAALGRDHRMGDGLAAVREAAGSSFPRVSADVIIGTPGTATTDLDASVIDVADTGVGHMSVYELTIEERTAFGRAARAGRLVPLGEDTLTRMYLAVHDALTGRGFEHYEISSYARPGQRSLHNQLYWRGAEYLGLGNGAASFRRLADGSAERITNLRGVKHYLAARGPDRVAEHERLSPADVAADLVWLGLRTSDGIPVVALDRAPGLRAWLLCSGLAEQRGERIHPTMNGFLYADHIAVRVVAEMSETG